MPGAPLSASVALVGPEYERSENLALRVLAAALREAGHRPILVPLTSPHDFEAAARLVADTSPNVVGISLTFEGSAWLLAALPRRLRDLGYAGPIVAGGVFATLHAEELLKAAPALDGVVRHDGEAAIVRLADATLGRARVQQVPGLVHRTDTDRLESTPCDFRESAVWPWRGPGALPRHLGLPSADLVGSRGCERSCPYCCVAALRSSARDHAQDFGAALLATTARRRSVDDIADEMANLSVQYGARVFHFQDDSFLPDDGDEAALFLEELVGALAHRKVNTRAVSVKLRGDQVSREVSALLAQLGVVRAFVGVDALTAALAKRLGRQPHASSSRAALGRLRRLGIATSFNSMAVGPEATLEEIQAELEALSTVRGVPFEIVRVVAYGGTELEHRLRQQGLLRGCAFVRRYDFVDPRVGQLCAAMERIATRHFGKRCPAKRVADLAYNVAIARHFYSTAGVLRIDRETGNLIERINADQVDASMAILAIMKRGDNAGSDAVTRVVAEAMRADGVALDTIGRLAGELETEVQAAGARCPRAYFRGERTSPYIASAAVVAEGCLGASEEQVSCLPRAPGGQLRDLLMDADDDAVTEVAVTSLSSIEREAIQDVTAELLDDADLLDDEGPETEVAAWIRGGPAALPAGAVGRPLIEHGCDGPVGEAGAQQGRGACGTYRATVRVDAAARATLVRIEAAGVEIAEGETVFACVADLLGSYDLSCFAGQTVVLEDQGPLD